MDHSVEIIAFAHCKAGDAFVGVDVHQLPIIMAGDVLGVVVDLCDVGVLLVIRIAADTGVWRYTELCDFLLSGFYDRYFRRSCRG